MHTRLKRARRRKAGAGTSTRWTLVQLRAWLAFVGVAAVLAAVPGAAAGASGRILFFEGGHVEVSVPTENSPGSFAMSGNGGLLQSFAEKLAILPILGDWTSDGS